MLRLFSKRGSNTTFSWAQISSFYSRNFSKKTGDDSKIPNLEVELPHPAQRVLHCLKRDGVEMKKKFMFWKDYKNPALSKTGKVIDWDNPHAPIFPNYCDVLIIGGGAIGSAAAYWCKINGNESLRVVVIEKDQSYKEASTVLSVGGLRQQFSLEENIEMSLFGAEFIRNADEYLGIPGEPRIDLQFRPYGYLSLASEKTAELLTRNSELQNSKGARNALLSKHQLKSKFPWLNTDDIELGCLGLENEGWFDPWLLLDALKKKAISMGVEFITATAKGFNFKADHETMVAGVPPGEYETIEYAVVETEDGKLRPITFSKCIIAAGAFSADIARMAKIGYGKNMLSVKLPVEPRKRYVYCFHAPDGPGLNTPMTIDTTGVYFRREGLSNNYICGRCPTEDQEPSTDNLDVDPEFFNEHIWPHLAHRVKAFENLKVKSSWAGYYEYNTFDENGVISFHPFYDNILFATGFSGHGIQHAPAVGRAVSELIKFNNFDTINLNRLSFDRFITLEPMREINIW